MYVKKITLDDGKEYDSVTIGKCLTLPEFMMLEFSDGGQLIVNRRNVRLIEPATEPTEIPEMPAMVW